ARASPPPISFRGRGLRGYARACPLTAERTGAGRSLGCDAGSETGLRTDVAARVTRPELCATEASLGDSDRRGAYLATALLRFRGEHRAQARGEVALYAPQPGAARSGSRARSMEMGQLS